MCGLLCSVAVLLCIAGVFYRRWCDRQRVSPLVGRCVLVTGCSTGFGRALTRRLDGLGVRVFATCRTETSAAALRDVTSDRVKVVMMDVTDTASIERALQLIKTQLPPEGLWALVNNAGVMHNSGPIEFTTRDNYLSTYEVNVVGMAEVTRLFLPLLKKSGGRVVNMSSLAGIFGTPDFAAYSASKFAAEGYSDCLRREMSPYGIKVSVIEPGYYKTEIVDLDKRFTARQKQWEAAPEELRREYGDNYMQEVRAQLAAVNEKASRNVSDVVAAYEHALFALAPRPRYVVTHTTSPIVPRILAMLPEAWADKVVNKFNPCPQAQCLKNR